MELPKAQRTHFWKLREKQVSVGTLVPKSYYTTNNLEMLDMKFFIQINSLNFQNAGKKTNKDLLPVLSKMRNQKIDKAVLKINALDRVMMRFEVGCILDVDTLICTEVMVVDPFNRESYNKNLCIKSEP